MMADEAKNPPAAPPAPPAQPAPVVLLKPWPVNGETRMPGALLWLAPDDVAAALRDKAARLAGEDDVQIGGGAPQFYEKRR